MKCSSRIRLLPGESLGPCEPCDRTRPLNFKGPQNMKYTLCIVIYEASISLICSPMRSKTRPKLHPHKSHRILDCRSPDSQSLPLGGCGGARLDHRHCRQNRHRFLSYRALTLVPQPRGGAERTRAGQSRCRHADANTGG